MVIKIKDVNIIKLIKTRWQIPENFETITIFNWPKRKLQQFEHESANKNGFSYRECGNNYTAGLSRFQGKWV